MHNKRNKQKLRQDAPEGPTSQPVIDDDDEVLYALDLEDLRKDVECPICLGLQNTGHSWEDRLSPLYYKLNMVGTLCLRSLDAKNFAKGIIRNTRVVMECMHRFCKECIEKSFRLGNNECPACRTHCSSRRSLREDTGFDELISLLFPNIDEYEEKEMAFSDDAKNNIKSMQEAYGKTLERQSDALGKKAAAATTRSKDKYSRSANQPLRRSSRNATAFAESSSSRDMTLPPIAEENETQVIPDSDINEFLIEGQSSQHETNASIVAGRTCQLQDLISSSDKLVWGRFGLRSHTNSNARHAASMRSNRLGRFIDHLQNSNQNDDELDICIKLVSFEEERVPNLARPYLNCRPTLSINQLCQYVANETLLETEEIELYVVKECDPDFVSGEGKLDPDKYETQFLERGDQTLAELKTNNLSFGHLVIAYKRKKWNLNEVLSCADDSRVIYGGLFIQYCESVCFIWDLEVEKLVFCFLSCTIKIWISMRKIVEVFFLVEILGLISFHHSGLISFHHSDCGAYSHCRP
ncbi:hypothetical protein VNO80_07040 [Phaseolus coccineus]|uniref:RING-type domain-containing protein n=1 Tax=Phaseolus coccineus TaxID=3886 RepID=A0AAN9RF10_PHACN